MSKTCAKQGISVTAGLSETKGKTLTYGGTHHFLNDLNLNQSTAKKDAK